MNTKLLLCGTLLLSTIPSWGESMQTRFLQRPEGRIAWSLHGSEGPLVVAMPGMGDIRQSWAPFCDSLARRGFRVATLDLRGHGESSVGFADVSARAIADDALALVDSLGERKAVFLGNSYTGATAVWLATDHPDRVRGVVLMDPFVREIPPTFLQKLTMALGMHRPWGPALWGSYYKSLFKDGAPAELDRHVERVVANMKEKGRFESLKAMAGTSADSCEARLSQVKVPALVLMGSRDPDFQDPQAEARLVAERIGGRWQMVDGAGHYPQVEFPQQVADSVQAFLGSLEANP